MCAGLSALQGGNVAVYAYGAKVAENRGHAPQRDGPADPDSSRSRSSNGLFSLVVASGIAPETSCMSGRRSIWLSYATRKRLHGNSPP